jgi:hypothetical protein
LFFFKFNAIAEINNGKVVRDFAGINCRFIIAGLWGQDGMINKGCSAVSTARGFGRTLLKPQFMIQLMVYVLYVYVTYSRRTKGHIWEAND